MKLFQLLTFVLAVSCATANQKAPDYGEVAITYDVDKDGEPHNIKIIRSSDPVFNDEAIKALKRNESQLAKQRKGFEIKGKKIVVEFKVQK